MKLDFRLIGTLFVLAGVACGVAAAAEVTHNIEGTIKFTPSCSPWNAQVYRLKIDLPDSDDAPLAHFEGDVWGIGIKALEAGQTFSMDGPEGHEDGTGTAYVSIGNRKPVFVKAKFMRISPPKTVAENQNFGEWLLEIPMPLPSNKTYYYQISREWDSTQTLCDQGRKLIQESLKIIQ